MKMRLHMNIDRKGVAVFRIVPVLVGALALATMLAPAAARPGESACVHTDAVFYSTDTILLAGRLHAAQSSCADYYLSVTPDANGFPRGGVAPVVRANGPQFHAMPEIRLTVWAGWVQQPGNCSVPFTDETAEECWYEAGVAARLKMRDAGYDVAQGDTWAINEVGASTPPLEQMAKDIFNGVGKARVDFRAFVHGLYTGTGEPDMPPARGLVFAADPTQITTDLGDYKQGLRAWYRDAPFWSDMSTYVRFWAQETYADARNWGVGVPPSSLADRASHLNDYFQHAERLADVDPDASSEARSFLDAAYTPVANAAYPWGAGFGFTNITPLQMQNFIATQTYALRSSPAATRFGFAWVPNNTAIPRPPPTSLAALRDTLAQSIQGSQTDPAGACGVALALCDSSLDGAYFTEAWKTFTDATPPVVLPEVMGERGANGWYVGDVTVSWNVSDPESAFTTHGCATSRVDTDTTGETFTCTAESLGGPSVPVTVTIKRDATPPALSVPDDMTLDATGRDGATVEYSASARDAFDPDPSVRCDPPSGSVFPLGTTTVGCTATDAAGNTTSKSFHVHVIDPTPPVVVPEVSGKLGKNGWYVGDVTVSWNVSDPESDFTTDGCATRTVDTDTAGTTFTCTATSLGGKTVAPPVTIKRDATPPALSVPDDIAVDATGPEGASIDYAVSATDALDPAPAVSCDPPPGSVFPVGTTTVACTATDAAGNISRATFAVHVRGANEQIGRLGVRLAAAHLPHGLTTALLAKLDAAARALASGDSACPHLDAFVTLVRNAERVGHMSAGVADAFAEAAASAADVSGC
jgi:hypothetical protein